MPESCTDASTETAKAADRYYQVFGRWVRSRMRSDALRQDARKLALAYRRALNVAIDCYRRIKRAPAAKRELEYAREIQTLLERDIQVLDSSTPELASQQQPQSD